jgi:hypothetical protein
MLTGDHVRGLLKELQGECREYIGQDMIVQVGLQLGKALTLYSSQRIRRIGLEKTMFPSLKLENPSSRSWRRRLYAKKPSVLYVNGSSNLGCS